MEINYIGQKYIEEFCISQNDVIKFSVLSGDTNPIHLDENYAKQTPFKKPIVHGFLSSSIFSKVFGTSFPGEGTIYLEQNMKFLYPIYPDQKYYAEFLVVDILEKNRASISTIIRDEFNKPVLEGSALIMNKNKIIRN